MYALVLYSKQISLGDIGLRARKGDAFLFCVDRTGYYPGECRRLTTSLKGLTLPKDVVIFDTPDEVHEFAAKYEGDHWCTPVGYQIVPIQKKREYVLVGYEIDVSRIWP